MDSLNMRNEAQICEVFDKEPQKIISGEHN